MQKFSPNGRFLAQVTFPKGVDPGAFTNAPHLRGVGPTGHLYLTDGFPGSRRTSTANWALAEFTANGEFIRHLGGWATQGNAPPTPGQVAEVSALWVDSRGNLDLYDMDASTIHRWNHQRHTWQVFPQVSITRVVDPRGRITHFPSTVKYDHGLDSEVLDGYIIAPDGTTNTPFRLLLPLPSEDLRLVVPDLVIFAADAQYVYGMYTELAASAIRIGRAPDQQRLARSHIIRFGWDGKEQGRIVLPQFYDADRDKSAGGYWLRTFGPDGAAYITAYYEDKFVIDRIQFPVAALPQ